MNGVQKIIGCALLMLCAHSAAAEWQVSVGGGLSGENRVDGSGLHNNGLLGIPCYEVTTFKNARVSSIAAGNARVAWFMNGFCGIDADLSYNTMTLLEQDVRLFAPTLLVFTNDQGFVVRQPAASMDFWQVYIGPVVRYKRQSGFWEKVTPYAGCGYMYSFGNCNHTFFAPGQPSLYGLSGTSPISSHAFAAKAGVTWEYGRHLAGIECKQVSGTFHIDSFRSFNNNGLDVSLTYTTVVLSVGRKF